MSDDIVTRLRVKESTFRMVVGVNDSVLVESIYSEAADEIERLRKVNDKFCDEVKTWRKLALAEHWLRVPDHLACDCLDKWVHDGM